MRERRLNQRERAPVVAVMAEAYTGGATIVALAAQHQVSYTTARRYLDEAGVVFRRRGRRDG